MSSRSERSVDERVVQMTFNNAEFEKGVSKSLSTLEKLKRALDFKHRPTGLEDFGKAIGSIEQNLAPIAKDVDHIADRFTALGIVGDQVIRNLTNKVVAFGEKMVKSVTVEPLSSGFSEYETQMKSIQTILANTGMEGQKGVAKVNAALDELNDYADKTIYNFTQMTENIGRFTAAGVKLEPAVSAIKGISNIAAMSGSTSEQAGRAMYNLSQALSTGTLKLMDWNSVVNAGMGGKVFQNALIQAAATMDGMGDKVDEWKAKHVDAFGSFRDSLSKGWITSDVLTEALHNFTYDVEEGTKEYEEALQELIQKGYTEEAAKGILKMARQATEAATKVRTFTQLIDTLKEALGSGWTESWRYIFGDFNEATEVFSEINRVLSNIIETSSKARNDVLKLWHDLDVGGRLEFLEALKELVYDIALIVKPVQLAFEEVFGAFNVGTLQKITVGFHNFAKALHPSEEGFYAIKRIAVTVFSIIKNGLKIVGNAAGAIIQIGKPLLYMADALLVAFSTLLDSFANSGAFSGLINGLAKIGQFISTAFVLTVLGLAKAFILLGDAVRSLDFGLIVNGIGDIVSGFIKWLKGLTPVSKALGFLKGVTDGARNAVEGLLIIVLKAIAALIDMADYIYRLPMIQYMIQGVKNILSGFKAVIDAIGMTIGNIFTDIGKMDLNSFANPLEFIKDLLITIGDNLTGAIKSGISFLEGKLPIFKTITGMVKSVVDAFKNGIDIIKDFFGQLMNTNVDFSGGEGGLRGLINTIKDFIAAVDPAKVAALGITAVMLAMTLTFIRIGNMMADTMATFKGLIGTIKSAINGYISVQTNKIIQAAEAILMIAAAIAVVAGIPGDDLLKATAALSTLLIIIGVISLIQEKLRMIPGNGSFTQNITNLGGVALMVLELVGAFAILIQTLNIIKDMNFEGLVNETTLTLAGLFVAVTGLAILMDRFKVGFSKGTLGILVLSGAIWSLSAAIKQLEGMNSLRIEAALSGLIPLMAMLAAISFAAKGIGLTTGLGLVLVANAIEKLMPTLKTIYDAFLENVPLETILIKVEEHKEAFNSIAGFVIFLTGILGFVGKGLKAVGTAILAISASFIVMAYALEKIIEVSKSDYIIRGVLVMTAMFAMISWWIVLSAMVPDKSAILKVGVAIALMASTLLIINLALEQFSKLNWSDPNTIGAGIMVIGFLALLGGLMMVAGKAGQAKGAFGIVASLMAGLSVMVAELIALSMIDWKDLVFPLISIGVIMALLIKSLETIGKYSNFDTQGVLALAVGVLGLISIAGMLYSLSDIPWKNLLASAVSLGAVILAVTLLFKVMSGFSGNAEQAIGASVMMISLAASIYFIADAMGQLAAYDWKQILGIAADITVVIVALGVLTAVMSSCAPRFTRGLGVAVVLMAIAGALYVATLAIAKLSTIPTDKINSALKTIIITMLGMLALIAVFSVIDPGTAIVGGLGAALAIGVFVATLITIFTAIAGLIWGLGELGLDVFGLLKDFAAKAGDAIGTFVSSFGEASVQSLPAIGTKLSEFADNASKFFEITKGIDAKATEGVLNLAKALLAMTGSNLIETLVSTFAGSNSAEKFKEALPTLAEGIKSYAEIINSVDQNGKKVDFTGIEESTKALQLLTDVAKSIPNEGGWLGRIMGENDMETFGSKLGALATGLVEYSNVVNTCNDWSGVDPSLVALQKITKVADTIPNAGGIIGEMFGENNIDVFAKMLPTVAGSLVSFAALTNTVTLNQWNSIEKAMDSLKHVVDVAKEIPNAGGIIGGIFGENDINDFGTKLVNFAEPFAAFATGVENVNTQQINDVADSLENLVTSLSTVEGLNLYTFEQIVPTIQTGVEIIMDNMVSSIKEHTGKVEAAIEEFGKALIKKGMTFNSRFRELGTGYADRIGKGLSSQGSIEGLATDIESLVGNAIDKATENLKKTGYDDGAEVGQEIVNGILGPKGIDPDETVSSTDSSDKVSDGASALIGNGLTDALNSVKERVTPLAESVGNAVPESIKNGIGNFSFGNTIDSLTSGVSTAVDVLTGNKSIDEVIADWVGGGSGSDLYKKIFGEGIFSEGGFNLFEGSDVESNLEESLKGVDGLSASTGKLGKATGSTSKSLSSAKDNLKEYNKYLKYATKVQNEFANTMGAAMSAGNGIAAIDNAKVAVKDLVEQIYADSKKVEDTVDDTEETVEQKLAAMMKAFNDDYESIKNSVSDSMDLFKNFYENTSEVTKPNELLRNAKSQFEGYTQLMDSYRTLALKGVPSDYIQKLAEKGADGIGEVNSLLQLSNSELSEFISYWEQTEDIGDTAAAQVMAARAISVTVKKLKAEASGHKAVKKEIREAYKEYKRLYSDLILNGGDPEENEDLIDFFNNLNKSCSELNLTLEDVEDSLNNVAGANAAATLELIESYTNSKSVIDEYKSTLSATSAEMTKLINDQLGGFDEFTKKTGISSEKMLSNLRSQVKGLNQWSKELSALAGKGLSDEIIKGLSALGPEGFEKVHAFYKMSSDEIQEANTLWGQRTALTENSSRMIATRMAESAVGGANAYAEALEDYAKNDAELKKALEEFSGVVTAGITEKTSADLLAGGKDAGKIFTDAMAKSIEENKSTSTKAAEDASKEATDASAETVKEETDKTVVPAVEDACETVVETAKKELDPKKFEEISKNATEGLVKGFNKYSPIHNALAKEAAATARIIPEAQRKELDEHSPSKVAEKIGEMYGVGLTIGLSKPFDSLKDILNDYLKAILSTTDSITKGVNKVGNVDINARPIVYNDDGSYSTTSTTFQEKWKGDEETGHYIIGHFATIRQNGTRLTDEELDQYIDTVLGSDDPFGTDANMENLLYAIADKVASGEYINDNNMQEAFKEAEAWDQEMHELQDSMYKDRAGLSYEGGLDTAFNFARGIIDGIVSMGNNMQQSAMQAATTVAQMVQSAFIQAAASDENAYAPVITPVINMSSAQNGFNTLGNMFGNPGFNVGFAPNMATPFEVSNDNNAMISAIRDNQYDDTRLVNEVSGLRNDLNALNEKMDNMQVVMDSGALVGSIGPKMDTELGTIYRRRNRG